MIIYNKTVDVRPNWLPRPTTLDYKIEGQESMFGINQPYPACPLFKGLQPASANASDMFRGNRYLWDGIIPGTAIPVPRGMNKGESDSN